MVQTSAAAGPTADMENLSANSFKKMYTDHRMQPTETFIDVCAKFGNILWRDVQEHSSTA